MLLLVVFVIHISILTFSLSMQSQSLHENSGTNG